MSTIAKLASTGQRLFYLSDLRLIWDVSEPGTLKKRVYRYLKNGDLYSIQRGLYSVVPPEKLNPLEVGVFLCHGYCYLSLQSILDRNGIINGRSQYFTYVSDKSRRLSWNNHQFVYRQLNSRFLFSASGILQENGVLTAGPERAVADMLYFNPKFHFDSPDLVDFAKVRKIQKEVGYI